MQQIKTFTTFANENYNSVNTKPMVKTILSFAFSAFLLCTPCEVKAQDIQRSAPIEQEMNAVTITVTEATVHVKNAEKQVLEIYNMAGVKVATFHIESNDRAIDLGHLPKGCYILKVGKVARKVYLR